MWPFSVKKTVPAVQMGGDDELVAPVTGQMFPIEQVKDEMFSGKMLGDGVAFTPEEDWIHAPAGGRIAAIFPTGHAFCMVTNEGVELLVHIGLDTVELEGDGFQILSEVGAQVKAGDRIVRIERDKLLARGVDLSTMLVVTDSNGKTIRFAGYGAVKAGDRIYE